MPKQLSFFMSAILFIGCLVFAYGIVLACYLSLMHCPENMPPFMATTDTTISAVFATNLGSVLGITLTNPKSDFHVAKNWNPLRILSSPNPSHLQILGCYFYVAGLLACAITWAILGLDTPGKMAVVPLIVDFTKSLLGIIVGVIAVSLNI